MGTHLLQRSSSWPSAGHRPTTSAVSDTTPKYWKSLLSLRILRKLLGPRLWLIPRLRRRISTSISTAEDSQSSSDDYGQGTPDQRGDLVKPPPLLLLPVASEDPAPKSRYRLSMSHQFLDSIGPNEEFEHAARPRVYAMRLSDGDGHRSVLRRQKSTNVSYTRSLDDLDQLPPDTEFLGWKSPGKVLYSLSSSEEDLSEELRDKDSPVEDYPVTTESDAESTGDELDVPSMQTAEQVSGDIELVVGFFKQHWCHCDSWKGEVTEDGHMRIYQDESKEREIHLPPENMSLSEEAMEEKVCKMTPDSTVYTRRF